MKSIIKKYKYFWTVALVLLGSCDKVKDWKDPADHIPPGVVTDIKVENTNGGARIMYTLPKDDDLLGVKAIYSRGNEEKETNSSFTSAFKDTLELAGYGDTLEHTVDLYAVDKSGNQSDPVTVKIKPLPPPIDLIRSSLHVRPTFGGIFVTWDNAQNQAIALSLYSKNSEGEMTLVDTYYSEAEEGKTSFRGFEAISQEFEIQMRDRWSNYAVPFDTTLSPLYEEEIFGKDPVTGIVNWTQLGWPGNRPDGSHLYRGDMNRLINNRFIDRAVDGELMSGGAYWHCSNNVLADFVSGASEGNLFPYYFTIDMGKKASYSRFRWWMRDRSPLYSAELPLDFEVWGTNTPKPINEIGSGSKEDNLKYWTGWPQVGGTDAWKKDWIKMADCHMQLPSGAKSPAELTNEDRDFIRAGIEYEIDPEVANVPFRYIRFCVYSTNTGVPQFMISELKFWGSYAE